MNRLLATTALGLLLGAAPAFAESQAPIGNPTNPPSVQAPQSPSDSPAAAPVMQMQGQSSEAAKTVVPNADVASEAPQPQFLKEQRTSEWLATTIIDKPVVNAANETIGDVNDLVTDAQGRVIAALIGVGGFLGIGEKDVAVPFQDLKLARDENDNVTVIANLSKDQLAAAPDYQSLDDQEVTQSSAASDQDGKTRTY